MALVNGTNYDHIDLHAASGGDVTRHKLQDSEARAMIGPTEASSTASAAHPAGSYFIYNNKLYQATSDIASGGTITPNTNCKEAPLGASVSDLKSAVNEIQNDFYLSSNHDYSSVTGSRWVINSSGKWYQVATTSSPRSSTFAIPAGTKIVKITAGANGAIFALLNSYNPSSYTSGESVPDYSNGSGRTEIAAGASVEYPIAADMKYLYVVLTVSTGADWTPTVTIYSTPAEIAPPMIADEYTSSGANAGEFVRHETGLYQAKEDASGDWNTSKFRQTTVGSELERIDTAHLASAKSLDAFYFEWHIGYYVKSDKTVGSQSQYALTYWVPVNPGNVIINNCPSADSSDRSFYFCVNTYTQDGASTAQERVFISSGGAYKIPDGIHAIRIHFGFAGEYTMTRDVLDEYFKATLCGIMQPFGLMTDGKHPYYVAFGPSTTKGLQYNNNTRTDFSRYAYPDYIGQVLNYKAYNLGVSGTGFLARKNGDDNFCDQIYSHSELLAKAGLVTIVFGYGNDEDAGLPAGVYTDYYPYDAEGYHPTGTSATAQMLQKGATLMGMLNWCIEWINTNYPYAQLIIAYGAPSLNHGRTITKTAQTEGAGVAPYTLTFTDPFSDPSSGGVQIHTEIQKLKAALGVPIIDMMEEGCPFSYYSSVAMKPGDNTQYALFGMKNSGGSIVWDSHPIEAGYLLYGRYIAGRIISLYKH